MNIKKFIGTKDFYKMVLALTIPIIIQNGITKFVSPILNAARSMPMERTVRPCMDMVIKANTCSIRQRILDFRRLFS